MQMAIATRSCNVSLYGMASCPTPTGPGHLPAPQSPVIAVAYEHQLNMTDECYKTNRASGFGDIIFRA